MNQLANTLWRKFMAKKKVFQISNALTEGLEETVSAAHNYSGELRVEAISLKKIELDPDNPRDLILTFADILDGIAKTDKDYMRKTAEKASLQSLAHSIKEQGIINPVVVYKHADKYRLIAGERRTLASLLAGKPDIQAKILESKPDELKISLLQWLENVERKDLSLWERLKNLEKMLASLASVKKLQVQDISATDLSRLLGCSLPHAMNYLAVLNADSKVKELIQHNKIKNLEKAALIASIKSIGIKQNAIDACVAGATLKKLKTISTQDKMEKKATVLTANSRGRQASLVNLGSTKKIKVARLIIDSVLKHEKLSHIKNDFNELNWTDYKSINHAFKQLIKTLEQIEA
jgi:ParB family transcriptional regulator, chromosome partitioning protein